MVAICKGRKVFMKEDSGVSIQLFQVLMQDEAESRLLQALRSLTTVKESGRLSASGDAPLGAWVGWGM